MAAVVTNVLVPYSDLMEIKRKSDERDMMTSILTTEFKDAECQLLALKAISGLIPKEEPEPEIPSEDPTETPDDGNDVDPTDPSDSTPDDTNPSDATDAP